MTNILKTSLTLTLDVEVKYQTLGAEPEHGLPEQIDLTAVSFTMPGKSRKRKDANTRERSISDIVVHAHAKGSKVSTTSAHVTTDGGDFCNSEDYVGHRIFGR